MKLNIFIGLFINRPEVTLTSISYHASYAYVLSHTTHPPTCLFLWVFELVLFVSVLKYYISGKSVSVHPTITKVPVLKCVSRQFYFFFHLSICQQAGEMVRLKLHYVQQGQGQWPASGEEQPHTRIYAGDCSAGKQPCRIGPAGPRKHEVEHKATKSDKDMLVGLSVAGQRPGGVLPRQAVVSLSLEMFKSQLDVVLGNWLWVALLGQGLYRWPPPLVTLTLCRRLESIWEGPYRLTPTCNFPLLWEGCSACNSADFSCCFRSQGVRITNRALLSAGQAQHFILLFDRGSFYGYCVFFFCKSTNCWKLCYTVIRRGSMRSSWGIWLDQPGQEMILAGCNSALSISRRLLIGKSQDVRSNVWWKDKRQQE